MHMLRSISSPLQLVLAEPSGSDPKERLMHLPMSAPPCLRVQALVCAHHLAAA